MMDEALLRPGRLEVQIEIGLPNEKGRSQILKVMKMIKMIMMMVMRKNIGYDEDENDIFQDGESSQQCRTPCSGKTWSSKYDDNDDGL